jgi:hypothetical protein
LPSFVSSSSNLESTPTSIFGVDCDAYHTTGLNELIKDHESCNNGDSDHEIYNSSARPIHFQCVAIDPATGLDDKAATWTTINVSKEAWPEKRRP